MRSWSSSHEAKEGPAGRAGWRQSREVAVGWTETPDLILTSPYLRTRQTATATIERFPNVPVGVWPIEEFTYLQPRACYEL